MSEQPHRTTPAEITAEESTYLDSDTVFAVKRSLLRRFECAPPTIRSGPRASKATGARSSATWC
jgi:hypothetical protein